MSGACWIASLCATGTSTDGKRMPPLMRWVRPARFRRGHPCSRSRGWTGGGVPSVSPRPARGASAASTTGAGDTWLTLSSAMKRDGEPQVPFHARCRRHHPLEGDVRGPRDLPIAVAGGSGWRTG